MKFDVDQCIELLKERKLPDLESIKQLCIRAREILAEESNVLEVPAPVTIVGDIHGQVSLARLKREKIGAFFFLVIVFLLKGQGRLV